MRRALLLCSAIASALLLLSCQRNQSAALPPATIADSKSCFSLTDVTFWDLSGTTLTQKGSVQVGEKLALLGQGRHVTLGGKERDLLRVRRDTGAEGWVRGDYVISNAILAVTTADAVIYSVPRNTAATTDSIPRMTVLAIHSDSGGMPFIHVSFYDPQQSSVRSDIYLRNEGVSARPDDVQAAILLQLAAESNNQRQREAFLTSGIKDYPGSLFLPQLQDALNALHSPAPQTQAGAAASPQAGSPPAAPSPTSPSPAASSPGASTPAAGPSPASPGQPPPASPAPAAQPPGQPAAQGGG